jgi:hypothetical protein
VISKHYAAERHYEMASKKQQVHHLSLVSMHGISDCVISLILSGEWRTATDARKNQRRRDSECKE